MLGRISVTGRRLVPHLHVDKCAIDDLDNDAFIKVDRHESHYSNINRSNLEAQRFEDEVYISPNVERRRYLGNTSGVSRSRRFACRTVSNPGDPVNDDSNYQIQQRDKESNANVSQALFCFQEHSTIYEPVRLPLYQKKRKPQLIRLNISGSHFLVRWKTLKKDQMVYEKLLEDAIWLEDSKEYYLERDPYMFTVVHAYLRYNQLHLPQHICGPLLEKELHTWGLELGFDLQRCCLGPVVDSKSRLESLQQFEKAFCEMPAVRLPCFRACLSARWETLRDKVWQIIGDRINKRWLSDAMPEANTPDLDEPAMSDLCMRAEDRQVAGKADSNSVEQVTVGSTATSDVSSTQTISESIPTGGRMVSRPSIFNRGLAVINWRHLQKTPSRIWFSRCYVITQTAFLHLTVLILMLMYLPEFRFPLTIWGPLNITADGQYPFPIRQPSVLRLYHSQSLLTGTLTVSVGWIQILNFVVTCQIAIDLIARLVFSPSFRRWFTSVYTIVDVFSSVPYFVEFYAFNVISRLSSSTKDAETAYNLLLALDYVNVLRMLVVLRLLRMLQRHRGTRVLIYTIKTTMKNMVVLLALLGISTVFFGVVIFYVEPDYTDVIHGMWWAMITMFTVGYGDIAPKTMTGYAVTVLCVIVGVLLTSYTVPILVNDFLLYYSHADQLAWMRRVHTRAEARIRHRRNTLIAKQNTQRLQAYSAASSHLNATFTSETT